VPAAPAQIYRKPHEPWVSSGEIDCQAADMTATIAADVLLRDLQRRLLEIDQWFPIDGEANRAVGELAEENSSGPLRLGYGAWRDLLLGCQFRIGSGELITAGGRTMKNVAGYDLSKFMVGQRGIFGKIVTVTVRTYRRPAGAIAARFAASDRFVEKLIDTPLKPRWAILREGELWCGWLDETEALDFFENQLPAISPTEILRQSVQADEILRGKLWGFEGDVVRAAVPPIRILEFAGEAGLKNWAADAVFGIVRGNFSSGEIERIQRAAKGVGGSAAFFAAGAMPRWEATKEEKQILSRLAEAFGTDADFH
jgi:hypothetical protein